MFHVKHLLRQLTSEQVAQLRDFEEAFLRLNRYTNLVSRRSVTAFWKKHVLDSLSLAHRRFPEEAVVVDWGTGGGLPVIPLAIIFPHVIFYAVDSNQRKQYAVRHMQRQLNLTNVRPWHGRAETFPYAVDYSVSRATVSLETLWTWHIRVAKKERAVMEDQWCPGLLCRKGGDLSLEINALHQRFEDLAVQSVPLPDSSGVVVHVRRL